MNIWKQTEEHRLRAGRKGHFAKAALVVVERHPDLIPQPLVSRVGRALKLRKFSPTTKAGHVVSLPYLRFQHGVRG